VPFPSFEHLVFSVLLHAGATSQVSLKRILVKAIVAEVLFVLENLFVSGHLL
jgi:hypothetical protein